jgi:hypothetical protein
LKIIITTCTKNKAVSPGFSSEQPGITPQEYLGNASTINQLLQTRQAVLSKSNARFGNPVGQQISFEMYTSHGMLYDKLRADPIFEEILKNLNQRGGHSKAHWFFLSGGYGLLHGAEIASAYQAVFDRGIARKEDIPFTVKDWISLPQILDEMFNYLAPAHIYVVGSAAYVKFIQQTEAFQSSPSRFEISKGRASSQECRQAVVDFAKNVF